MPSVSGWWRARDRDAGAGGAHPWQGPVLRQDVLHHQHLQHFLDAPPADGAVLVPPPPAEAAAHTCPPRLCASPPVPQRPPPAFPGPSLLPSGTTGSFPAPVEIASLWRIFFRDPAGPHLAYFRFVHGRGPWQPCPSSHRPLREGTHREVRGALLGGETGLGCPGDPDIPALCFGVRHAVRLPPCTQRESSSGSLGAWGGPRSGSLMGWVGDVITGGLTE